MFKKIFVVLISGLFILGISNLSFAMMCSGHAAGGKHAQIAQAESSGHQHETMVDTQASSKEDVNAGNKICPVSGEKIVDKLKATYEYNGKIYNFCCASCVGEFKKDPEKYIKKVEEELQVESKGQSQQSQR